MIYIRQEIDTGCLIAALAMVTGKSYRRIRALCDKYDKVDGGINEMVAEAVLAHLGYAYQKRYHYDPRISGYRAQWPPSPFAPAHIGYAHVQAGFHAFAMDEHGKVFDPWKQERESIAHPDYIKVDQVCGVWKIM